MPVISQVAKLMVLSARSLRTNRPPLLVFVSAAILELVVWGLIGGVNPSWGVVDALGPAWLNLIRLPFLLFLGMIVNWAAYSNAVKNIPGFVRPGLVLAAFTVLPLVISLALAWPSVWLVGTYFKGPGT